MRARAATTTRHHFSPRELDVCRVLCAVCAVYGNDYKGNTCGVDKDVSGRKFTVYPRVNEVRGWVAGGGVARSAGDWRLLCLCA